jgi:hypothetical protein
MSNYTASEKQFSFIARLVAERTQSTGISDVDAFAAAIRTERLTGTGASNLINLLLGGTYPVDVAAPSSQDARGNLPQNRYAGDCVVCGVRVAASEGTYRRGKSGGWETLHLPGQCPDSAPVAAQDAPRVSSFAEALDSLADLPDGYYAVPSVTGSNDLTFARIWTNQGRVNPANKGKRGVTHIVGGDKDSRVGAEWITKFAAAVRAIGTEEAQSTYGRAIGSCGACGRTLTDETSRARGLGPECAGKFGH